MKNIILQVLKRLQEYFKKTSHSKIWELRRDGSISQKPQTNKTQTQLNRQSEGLYNCQRNRVYNLKAPRDIGFYQRMLSNI